MAEELASKENEIQEEDVLTKAQRTQREEDVIQRKSGKNIFLLGVLFRWAVVVLFILAAGLFALYAAGCYPIAKGFPFSDALQARILRLCLFASIALCAASAVKIIAQIAAAFIVKKSSLLSIPVFVITLLFGAALAFASSFILSAAEGTA